MFHHFAAVAAQTAASALVRHVEGRPGGSVLDDAATTTLMRLALQRVAATESGQRAFQAAFEIARQPSRWPRALDALEAWWQQHGDALCERLAER